MNHRGAVSYDDGDSDVEYGGEDEDEDDTSHCITWHASRESTSISRPPCNHKRNRIPESCRRIRAPAGPHLYIPGERRWIASFFSLSGRRPRRGDPRERLPSSARDSPNANNRSFCASRWCVYVCLCALTVPLNIVLEVGDLIVAGSFGNVDGSPTRRNAILTISSMCR